MLNPAVAGTTKTIDARMNYRNQWVGFDGAPKTMGVSAHGRFYKGMMGAGGYVYRDQIGPSSITTIALAYAFHLKFEDTELSIGINGNYNMQKIDPSKITYQNTQDPVITDLYNYTKSNIPNAAFGVLYYNDRFHVGAAMNNLLGTTYEFPKQSKTRRAEMKTVPHYSFSVGYNWSENQDFVWENNLFANLVVGTPILIDYNLRLHIQHKFFVGAGIRLANSVIGQFGYTIEDFAQVSYSYDYSTNNLRPYNSGTHEIKLVYLFDKNKLSKHGQNKRFQHQKFQYLL
jgi:type IX secretion system PorP/SprF family membrane protein